MKFEDRLSPTSSLHEKMTQKLNRRITASAPGKLMLAGSYAVVHGRPCLVTAVNQRLFVTVEKTTDHNFYLDAPDLNLKSYTKDISFLSDADTPKAASFIEAIYQIFLRKHPQKNGLKVTTKSEFSCNFGFGSSSAVSVAFAKALATLYGVQLGKKALFDLCYQAVLAIQGVGSGFDLAAAIWGGTIYYVSPAKIVKPLRLKKLPVIVGYTGIKADTPTLVKKIDRSLAQNPTFFEPIFDEIGEVVEKMTQALTSLSQDWAKVGDYLNQHQNLMRKLEVSSHELENLISASLQSGAVGAGLSGAGGGDCMLSVVNERVQLTVAQAITQAGGEILQVKLNAPGVRIESSKN